eukprot:gnl/TRDRNA2_/TRDRNA2_83593_c0_seq1.p1 gnl/TRDRNA2_/TRDRNA2_83593_c0~~gnl/TRDRNA2_/TRDRNA2_83593_c0_seq1.p1  ORF type:complete len:341 (+),score=57.12 gnl/TRDRNA2_/TRDRNA2_83593_c0_seq1:108-1130(+)
MTVIAMENWWPSEPHARENMEPATHGQELNDLLVALQLQELEQVQTVSHTEPTRPAILAENDILAADRRLALQLQAEFEAEPPSHGADSLTTAPSRPAPVVQEETSSGSLGGISRGDFARFSISNLMRGEARHMAALSNLASDPLAIAIRAEFLEQRRIGAGSRAAARSLAPAIPQSMLTLDERGARWRSAQRSADRRLAQEVDQAQRRQYDAQRRQCDTSRKRQEQQDHVLAERLQRELGGSDNIDRPQAGASGGSSRSMLVLGSRASPMPLSRGAASARAAGKASLKESTASECAICLESIGRRDGKVMSCGHTFHEFCITRWLTARPTCPLCRATVS